MRRWFEAFPSVLREREPQGGGGDTMRVLDPGAEHQLDDDEPGDRTPAPAKKSAAEERADELAAENTRLRKQADDAVADAKFWSDRAKRATPARTDDEPAPRRTPAAAVVTEKPEELIDDLNKKGLQALKDRGFVSKEDLEAALETQREQTAAEIDDARSEAVFSARLEAEFPEMMEDSARAAKGLAPKSELFIKAGEIYRELVDLDPALKNSRGLLVIAARQAKAQLEKAAKPNKTRGADDDDTPPSRRTPAADDQAARRQKIDRQRPDRGRDDDDSEGAAGHSDAQLEIMKRLKVKPEEFDKHRDAAPARRRK